MWFASAGKAASLPTEPQWSRGSSSATHIPPYLGMEMPPMWRIFLWKQLPAAPVGMKHSCTDHGSAPRRGDTQTVELRMDFQQGHLNPRNRVGLGSQLTWPRSSTEVHTPCCPVPGLGPTQPCPAAPGQPAVVLHGPGHLLPEREGTAEKEQGAEDVLTCRVSLPATKNPQNSLGARGAEERYLLVHSQNSSAWIQLLAPHPGEKKCWRGRSSTF